MKTAPQGASPMDTRETILVLPTGGTIDKQYFDAKSCYQITDSVVTNLLTVAGVTHPYVIEEVLRKDSLDLTKEDRVTLVERIRHAPFSRIVITHGTDTMTLTARSLAEFIDRTIVLTGALAPARFTDSDAAFNLGMAFAAAQMAPPGVYVAINGSVSLAERIEKDPERGCFVPKSRD
jgi:L-asparaginase